MAKAKTAKATEATGEVAVMNYDTLGLKDVPTLLANVKSQIELIEGNSSEKPKTKGRLDDYGAVEDMNSAKQIIEAIASIKSRKAAYDKEKEAQEKRLKEAGVLIEDAKFGEYKLGEYSAESWIADLEARLPKVINKKKLEDLKKVKEGLEKHLSEEDKLKNTLQGFANIISGNVID